MPVRPRKPCSTFGCPHLVQVGTYKCDSCSTEQIKTKGMQSSTKETRKIYNSPRWRAMRARNLKKYPICQLCHVDPSRIQDHIIAIGLGGEVWATSNLQMICDHCDRIKRGLESQEYRKRGIKKNA